MAGVTLQWLPIFVFMIIISLFSNHQKASNCPPLCTCSNISNVSFVINCSDKGQTRVPDFSGIVVTQAINVYLYLNGNKYFHIFLNSLSALNGKIRVLEIQNNLNKINLADSVFMANKDSLQVLKLDNASGNVNEILEILSSMKQIRELRISSSNCQPVELIHFVTILVSLKSAVNISFSHCGIKVRSKQDIMQLNSVEIIDVPSGTVSNSLLTIVALNTSSNSGSSEKFQPKIFTLMYSSKIDGLICKLQRSMTNRKRHWTYYFRIPSRGCLYLYRQNVADVQINSQQEPTAADNFLKADSGFTPGKTPSFNGNAQFSSRVNYTRRKQPPCRCYIRLQTLLKAQNSHSKRFCKDHHGKLVSLTYFYLKCLLYRISFGLTNIHALLGKAHYEKLMSSITESARLDSSIQRRRYRVSYITRTESNASTMVLNRVEDLLTLETPSMKPTSLEATSSVDHAHSSSKVSETTIRPHFNIPVSISVTVDSSGPGKKIQILQKSISSNKKEKCRDEGHSTNHSQLKSRRWGEDKNKNLLWNKTVDYMLVNLSRSQTKVAKEENRNRKPIPRIDLHLRRCPKMSRQSSFYSMSLPYVLNRNGQCNVETQTLEEKQDFSTEERVALYAFLKQSDYRRLIFSPDIVWVFLGCVVHVVLMFAVMFHKNSLRVLA